MEINSKEKKQLLKLARKTIQKSFKENYENIDLDIDSKLMQSKCGVFVTLSKGKKLRGCIGYLQSNQPLFKTVREAAHSAAFGDPRFSPMLEEELTDTSIEVSILSEPFELNNYDEIILGEHGLILEEGGRKGLLLPQVPIEYKMNKDQYLSALCNKAGLYSEYWREKQLNLKAFTATVFSEEELDNE